MRQLRAEIATQTEALAKHPFLVGLESSDNPADLRRIIPQLYFWVFAFQDVLRLSESRVTNPEFKAIASTHREEDAGHEHWFTHDAKILDAQREVSWVFGEEHQRTRDTSYEMIAEVLKAEDDRIRLVLPLILESIGSVFFPRVVGLVERTGIEADLRYFARSHQDVEAGHDLFTEGTQLQLDDIDFDEAVYAEGLAVVERCFGRAHQLATHLEAHRRGDEG